jgi:hypothetical protein
MKCPADLSSLMGFYHQGKQGWLDEESFFSEMKCSAVLKLHRISPFKLDGILSSRKAEMA